MSRKSRKAERKALQDRLLKEQAEARRNPDLPPEERAEFDRIVAAMQAELDRTARSASVATPARQPSQTGQSHIGGSALCHAKRGFLRRAKPDWPKGGAGALSLALELYPDELPVRPSALEGIALFQLFLQIEPGETPAYTDGTWRVRTFESLEGLEPASEAPPIPEIPLTWHVETTVPGYPDSIEALDPEIEDAFHALPDSHALYADLVETSFGGLKVGGWPTWLQGGDTARYVLQISGDIMGVDLGFDGILFIGFESGRWTLFREIG